MCEFIIKMKKPLAVILMLLTYFSLLTLVSLVRAPEEYEAVGGSLVTYENFGVTAEENRAWVDERSLNFSDSEGTEKVFFTEFELADLHQIMVRFRADCSADWSGNATLHVDLYADGYDAEEQEFTVALTAGQNEVAQIIDKGSNAPDKAQIRIFCLDAVQCEISDLSVQKVESVSHHMGKFASRVCIVLFASMLVVVLRIGRGKGAS